MAAQPQ